MIDFDTFSKIDKEWGRFFGKLIVAKALKSCPKSNKLPNLVALVVDS